MNYVFLMSLCPTAWLRNDAITQWIKVLGSNLIVMKCFSYYRIIELYLRTGCQYSLSLFWCPALSDAGYTLYWLQQRGGCQLYPFSYMWARVQANFIHYRAMSINPYWYWRLGQERRKLGMSSNIYTSTSRKKGSRKRWLRCHRNVDPETVLPRTGLIRGTPEKPSAHFTTAKTYVGIYIYRIYICMYISDINRKKKEETLTKKRKRSPDERNK